MQLRIHGNAAEETRSLRTFFFLFSIFGITFCVRERRDFCVSVLNGLCRKIASILDLFLNGLPTRPHFVDSSRDTNQYKSHGCHSLPRVISRSCLQAQFYIYLQIYSLSLTALKVFSFLFFYMPQRSPLLSTSALTPYFVSPSQIVCTDEWTLSSYLNTPTVCRRKLVLLVISTSFHVSTK